MPKGKKNSCPMCADGEGIYFVVVTGATTLQARECPIHAIKQSLQRKAPAKKSGEVMSHTGTP